MFVHMLRESLFGGKSFACTQHIHVQLLVHGLHTGLLGPVNQTIKKLKELVPGVEGFMKMNNIKGSGCGGDLNGPSRKKRLQVKPKANKLYKEALEQCNHNNHVSKFL